MVSLSHFGPVVDWWTAQGVMCPRPMTTGIGSSYQKMRPWKLWICALIIIIFNSYSRAPLL